ncbi:phage tail assembly protein T [Streptomyces sp. NPDC003832]
MSSRELSEWMAYERITGPLDDRLRAEINAGIVSATVANVNGAKRKPADFLPTWHKRKRTAQELWAEVLKVNTALGGTISRPE